MSKDSIKIVCGSFPFSFDYLRRGFYYRDINSLLTLHLTSKFTNVYHRGKKEFKVYNDQNCLGVSKVKTMYSLRTPVISLTKWIQKPHFKSKIKTQV